ncbi:Uracil-DNA glycosylase [Golovinomyces cichoracearum]|uniref:Uracil-DNA glycosylase n=1 Tax=Golovinomyces cichoracearum TaxID=62708 RepID=A0A420J9X8_9PEZI|nr:Uracil-DNA glycosylase [Golovinomyces cichoracearum]
MSSPLKRKAITTLSTNEVKKPKINSSITSFFTKPKSDVPCKLSSSPINDTSFSEKKTTVAAIEPKNFDKVAWVNTLTGEQKRLLKLEIDTLHESWMKELKDDMLKPSFLDLKRFLQKEKDDGKTIFPPEKDIYSWSRYTPLSEVKAVILGQDPYHNFSQAHGLSFSVKPPTSPPPSLRNIFLALKKDYPTSFRPPPFNTGDLTPWARQGVLMLNTCLTVRAHEANSHANHGWEMFTQSVIDIVAKKRTNGVVFLAWGTPARKRVDRLNKQRHLILLSVHPSPLSAQRGWFECGHFRKTNEWLASRYGGDSEIDWNLDTNFKEMNDKKVEVTVTSNKDVFSAASDAAPDEETIHDTSEASNLKED